MHKLPDRDRPDLFTTTITDRRLALNLSQEELAKRIGVTGQALSFWETGKVMPNATNKRKLLYHLGLDTPKVVHHLPQPQEEPIPQPNERLELAEEIITQMRQFLRTVDLVMAFDGARSQQYADLVINLRKWDEG